MKHASNSNRRREAPAKLTPKTARKKKPPMIDLMKAFDELAARAKREAKEER